MAVERNRDWGIPAPLPADGVIVHSNAEALAVVSEARRKQQPLPTLGLAGGDLATTLGATGDVDRLHSAEATTFAIDLGAVLIDGRLHWFVAHLVARRSLLRGPFFAAMNADHLGHWNLAPRAHPGDGELDVVEADLTFNDRLRARARLRTGTHVPHPDIRIRRSTARQVSFERPTPVWLDGVSKGQASALSIRVEPEALRVVV